MPPLFLMIKPASSLCNLECKYCFYHSLSEQREQKSYGIMSYETLENIVSKAFEYGSDTITFGFQGGEPIIAGMDFFNKFVDLLKIYNTKKCKVIVSIQTNATLIDESWAKFFRENDFLVGISLDGPRTIHDKNRIDKNGDGSFKKVITAIGILEKYRVNFNILCVVNKDVAKDITRIYNFFKSKNFRYLQFIPCLDSFDSEAGSMEHSLTVKDYGDFLKELFDLWYDDMLNGQYYSIRNFDNYVGMLRGGQPESCGMSGKCSQYLLVESGGQVYPCDFYAIEKFYMGNINSMGINELFASDVALSFIENSKNVDQNCKECEYYFICRGGCRRNREGINKDSLELNYYCSAYKEFLKYSIERMKKI